MLDCLQGDHMALHFVGFRDGSQLWRAMQIWGIPDFIHIIWDSRAAYGGERDESDVFIFAKGTIEDVPATHTVDDSSDYTSHYRKLTGSVPW